MWIMCGFVEIASRRESTWDLSYTQVAYFGADFAVLMSLLWDLLWMRFLLYAVDDSPFCFSNGIIMVLHVESFSLYGRLKESFSACGGLIFRMSNEHMLLFLKPTG